MRPKGASSPIWVILSGARHLRGPFCGWRVNETQMRRVWSETSASEHAVSSDPPLTHHRNTGRKDVIPVTLWATGFGVLFVTLIVLGFVARRQLGERQHVVVNLRLVGWRWFVPLLRPYRFPLGVGLALILSSTLLHLASPWTFKLLVDHAIGGAPLPGALQMIDGWTRSEIALLAIGAGFAMTLLGVVTNYLISYLIGAAEIRLAADMRVAIFRRLQDVSLQFHDQNRTGDLVSRLTSDVRRVRETMIAWLDRVIPESLSLVGVLIIMVFIDVRLTLIALTVIPLLAYYAVAKRPKIRRVQRIARDRRGDMVSHATDSLRNVRIVQAFARQDAETVRFGHRIDESTEAAIEALDVGARYRPISTVVLGAGSALVSWFGVTRVLSGEMTLGTLLVVLSYLSSLYSPVRTLSRLVSTFAKGAASRDRLLDLFADDHLVEDSPGAVEAPWGPQSIHLRGVTFRYDEKTPVLEGADLDIAAGESVCIVGASGVGKSTLLALLLRLYEPSSGGIWFGERPLKQLSLQSLRERIALVPQDPWMIDGSIRDNILFGHTTPSDFAFRTAVTDALVHQFTDQLPAGLDTPVGESGLLLSGGQRRRIALARALLKDASVLLLDEPTTGLDASSSRYVLDAIDRARHGRTAILVSHDLKLARHIDQILVMNEGRFVEYGTHDALVAASGRYADLWRDQTQLRIVPPVADEVPPLRSLGQAMSEYQFDLLAKR